MRCIAIGLGAALALTTMPAPSAEAHDRPGAYTRAEKREAYERRQRRSTTEMRDGTCVRDTGRPMNSLDLNRHCDRQEFWARFNDLGDSRR